MIPGNEGLLINIQRCSVHDGPGIRTTVFTKGCNLHCFWCHNPESISTRVSLQIFRARCKGCGECLRVCPNGAATIVNGSIGVNRETCSACGLCVDVCPENARALSGYTCTVEQVMREIRADRPFYERSGGGVTLSGGEPLLQLEFTSNILQRCHQEGIHTAIETAGNYPWKRLAGLLPEVDLVMMDLKHMDAGIHREVTGVGNIRILETARHLASTNKPLLFRTPIIPGVNDSPEAITDIAKFVDGLVHERSIRHGETAESIQIELLPFHPLASDKYRSLDMANRSEGLAAPKNSDIRTLQEVFLGYGISVYSWR